MTSLSLSYVIIWKFFHVQAASCKQQQMCPCTRRNVKIIVWGTVVLGVWCTLGWTEKNTERIDFFVLKIRTRWYKIYFDRIYTFRDIGVRATLVGSDQSGCLHGMHAWRHRPPCDKEVNTWFSWYHPPSRGPRVTSALGAYAPVADMTIRASIRWMISWKPCVNL